MKLSSFLFSLIAAAALLSCRHQDKKLLNLIPSSESGVHFSNNIVESDSLNVVDVTNIYNGGGVGIGDFNNDGLPDIYFTGNTVSNKLYLNQGKLKFRDITDEAGVGGEGRWCRGVSVIDINNDGLLDIYISASMLRKPEQRRNLLYINQGIDKDHVPHFKEMAAEYGLADTTHSTMATFFDYDNDGDLDMYLTVNQILPRDNPSQFRPIITNGSHPSTGRLYRNDWSDQLKHPVFTDVSKQAGITIEGYGHAATVADFNNDGWKDIYVSNDFISSDILYINNHDGTFTNRCSSYFKHTSANSMGQDVEDINNDGLQDLVVLDMNPEDNYRKKTMMAPSSYRTYQNTDYYHYEYQYVRNTLQLNEGPRGYGPDSVAAPVFQDIGFFSGMAETDWSWTPLLADFNNDGFRDLIVTNGFPKDITDRDFINFRKQSYGIASIQQMLREIPEVKLRNYAFKNNGDLSFSNTTEDWGLTVSSFSNGAAYADLDNDGDLDCVINNINDEAFIYENTTNSSSAIKSNYLQIKFQGDQKNLNGLGAWAELHYNHGKRQVYENNPYRGYLSSIEAKAFFGLDSLKSVDSVIIRWPGNKKQVLTNVKANQLLVVDIKNANLPDSWDPPTKDSNVLFSDVTTTLGLNYVQQEADYIDFDRERLIPHKLSQYGPGLAAGDIDGNGLDDIFVGGSANYPGEFLLQGENGKFTPRSMPVDPHGIKHENMGILLFDADGDGDLDLYCASGSNEFPDKARNYGDEFFLNDGKGNFKLDSAALPANLTSKSCVKAVDFDNDGDLDLFVGGRCLPGQYPMPVSSFIYRNDTKNGVVKFTDVTNEVCPALKNIGMVCDAIWTDFDNDGWTDLILAGEWMPITFFKNNHGKLENITTQTGVGTQTGWWNSIVAGDFDNDGDIDYVVGNLGQNSFFRASEKYPVNMYAKDFDKNGGLDAIMTVFLKDQKGDRKEYFAMHRDDLMGQLPGLKKKFLTYKDFAKADIHDIFSDEQMKGALVLHANNFRSCLLKNDGNGKFEMIPLPVEAQLAPLGGMVVDDFNGDGFLDLAMVGNDYGNEVSGGRYDAMNGLLMLGDGSGQFKPLRIWQSGFFVPGDAKALIELKGPDNASYLVASQNKGPLKIFNRKAHGFVALRPTDQSVLIKLKNGQQRKQELYFGSSFLSQSSHTLEISDQVKSISIKNVHGETRSLEFK